MNKSVMVILPLLSEIRDPRRGAENIYTNGGRLRTIKIEIRDPRRGDENQMGLIFLASS